ncbi:MAG: hypothetical protein HXY37_04760 [Chloroflexi bacterium]|nr:hypothetical protein [Chloroflexota bacterium]
MQRAIATWTPRLVALLIALELGLLSPLSCVIHCVGQQLLAERPAIAFFLCGEHSQTPAAAPLTLFDTSPDPVSQITPRALYEVVALATPLVALVSLLIAVLIALPARRIAPLTLPPPTPPPRLSPA